MRQDKGALGHSRTVRVDKFKTFLKLDLLKAITQLILAQKQHPGPFLETREQTLSFGTKINVIFRFIVGDIRFLRSHNGHMT